ncbi:hypothetical protein WISP_121904 [Willisornis vidua]|uniref:Reverse transcriptase domain-containing protein n=1 Tax=Willisornis vidua TaxID=1566151 RepID=A0ABQ9CXK4_9PASS|nr:hypothetical protein WISP_121904 [Willisornis vidua]
MEELAKLLSIIYYQSWLTREVPDDWRLASVMTLHKKGQKEDLGDQVIQQVDEGKAVDIVYLDFSKVFDTISQGSLLEKLATNGQEHSMLR